MYLPKLLTDGRSNGHKGKKELQRYEDQDCCLPQPLVDTRAALQADGPPLKAVAPAPQQLQSTH